MIVVDGVVKRYDSGPTIGPVSLTIPSPGITSFIGPNGAGKSTLLTIMARMLPRDEGTVTVGGMDVWTEKSRTVATRLAILRQDNHFVTRLTVRQLVGFGRFPYSGGRLTAADEDIVSRYIDFVRLGDLEHRFLDELSGGQRQRAYVAMVLAQETDYILLDEPLNNLDVAHSAQMMRFLRSAATDMGRCIVMVVHDINFALRYSDRVCMFRSGQLAYEGTPADVMTPGILSEVFGTPIAIADGPAGPVACIL